MINSVVLGLLFSLNVNPTSASRVPQISVWWVVLCFSEEVGCLKTQRKQKGKVGRVVFSLFHQSHSTDKYRQANFERIYACLSGGGVQAKIAGSQPTTEASWPLCLLSLQ